MAEEKDGQEIKPGDLRTNLRSPLLIQKVRLENGGKAFFGYAKNISRSGIFIGTVNPREPGDRFKVEIPLPAPLYRTIHVTCEVIWKREFSRKSDYEPGMGMKFLDLAPEVADAIALWIKARTEG